MLTEKECRQALEILKARVNYENVDAIICFKDYGETVLIRGVDKEENLVFLSAIDRKCELEYEFEPNCFYRKKVQK